MNDRDLAKTVEELQEALSALERRHDDLALKTQMMSTRLLGSWGWNRFLSEPEFWENIMDVGLSECSKRCSKTFRETKDAIAANTSYTPEQRQAAIQEAEDAFELCQKGCTDRFPIPF